MKVKNICILSLITLLFATSCFEDQDDNGVFASDINDFVWKGMNAVYLYKSQIPDLANDRFSSNEDYATYLNTFDTPESLFESLIYDRTNIDKYSWITDDYIALEQQFDGISKTNGMEFGLRLYPDGSSNVYGYVRYVLPNTSASTQFLQRGQLFYAVNGEPLYYNSSSDTNINLLNGDNYTLTFATYDDNGTEDASDDSIIPSTETMTLEKGEYNENPVYNTNIINVGGENVGYLMYTGFIGNYESQLNNVFSFFASNNVQHLVLDLRYNPGGNIQTASYLGSMITGQFSNDVFAKLQYNSNFEERLYNFETALDDGTSINSLNLTKVYVLTTGSSASASEMIINSLSSYIDVVQIGTTTEGKSQASTTIYDSADFGRQGANPNHTYALQPLVAISVNKNDGQVPSTGLVPNHVLEEDVTNLGVLGNENEPLLAKAIELISGMSRPSPKFVKPVELIADSNSFEKFAKEMYIDNIFQN